MPSLAQHLIIFTDTYAYSDADNSTSIPQNTYPHNSLSNGTLSSPVNNGCSIEGQKATRLTCEVTVKSTSLPLTLLYTKFCEHLKQSCDLRFGFRLLIQVIKFQVCYNITILLLQELYFKQSLSAAQYSFSFFWWGHRRWVRGRGWQG